MTKQQWRAYARLQEARCLVLRMLDSPGGGAEREEGAVAAHLKHAARQDPSLYSSPHEARQRAMFPRSARP